MKNTSLKLVVGCDHAACDLKAKVIAHLQAQGYAVPETFNHGTSAQRSRWLKKGFTTGDIQQGDTFSQRYNSL